MKFGQQLEQESVPEWSLHNLDYNSLKHEIKAHTTRDQAAAMTIPGHPDLALRNFEDGLYAELDRQHDRLHLFVNSKADEISRRLEHLDFNIQRWICKCASGHDTSISLKRQRRFAKYERELLRCGQDIFALSRFASAQVVAFRKILKKYRKWTGSSTLTSRFTETILGNPKSFTKRDFTPLQARYDDILGDLRASVPSFSKTSSPSSVELSQPEPPSPGNSRPAFGHLPAAEMEPRIKYWNEYDDGSDGGGPEDEYAIYINPDNEVDFPGLAYVRAITTLPYEKAKQWFERRKSSDETRPLLSSAYARPRCSSPTIESEEEGYSSSDAIPHEGYSTYCALPSTSEQKVTRYRERVLLRGTVGCFLTSFVLLVIAGVLICTGKRKLRVEVDAGVTLGVMVSLLCACCGLGMTLYRRDALRATYRLVVWGAFVASCLLNGMLLVMVLGSTP
ncbi:SPX domain-containing protein [Hirsutella rhossiliensis]|uniref:SPX domain-containing protein n=1 Tax=Hirsutella rhossiliensis TaxID=111463 RepID=A0A9P8MQI0_9HYPO|nr:SPX domain-containing protein [Hirsutella rhossiliensis]KAH0958331.1 SPX domain-containing protein [Hirsutella rhossiliensis]